MESHLQISFMYAVLVCGTIAIGAEEREDELFTVIGVETVAFPTLDTQDQSSQPLTTRKDDWVFTVSDEADRRVLSARFGDKLISQSITPSAVYKRFAFDMRKQRFEPMRHEIRIEDIGAKGTQEIEQLTEVSAVKRYERLGFSIVKVKPEVNPVEVFRKLKTDFDIGNVRILTGFVENVPM